MDIFSRGECRHILLKTAVLSLFLYGRLLVPGAVSAAEQQLVSAQPGIRALLPGERLTYDVSWSRILSAGTAVMEIKSETLPGERPGLLFVTTGSSKGAVNKIFPVNDTVRSTFDPQIMKSLSYSIRQSH